MSKHKKESARIAWNKSIFKRDGYICVRCLSKGKVTPAVDAHHIVHKTQGLALRYELDNGVALCRTCHDMDAQGNLTPWCIAYIGMEKYNKLLEMKHGIAKQELVEMGLTMDEYLDNVIKRLKEMG